MREPDEFEVTFAPDRAVFRRLDGDIEIRTELAVSPEDDAELRRVSITNHGRRPRRLDLTSYAEVVLAPRDADLAHPVFGNLFVETRVVPEHDALLAVRRPACRRGPARARSAVAAAAARRSSGRPTARASSAAVAPSIVRAPSMPGSR